MLLQSRQDTHDINYLGGTTSQETSVYFETQQYILPNAATARTRGGLAQQQHNVLHRQTHTEQADPARIRPERNNFPGTRSNLVRCSMAYAICAKPHRISVSGYRAHDSLDAALISLERTALQQLQSR